MSSARVAATLPCVDRIVASGTTMRFGPQVRAASLYFTLPVMAPLFRISELAADLSRHVRSVDIAVITHACAISGAIKVP